VTVDHRGNCDIRLATKGGFYGCDVIGARARIKGGHSFAGWRGMLVRAGAVVTIDAPRFEANGQNHDAGAMLNTGDLEVEVGTGCQVTLVGGDMGINGDGVTNHCIYGAGADGDNVRVVAIGTRFRGYKAAPVSFSSVRTYRLRNCLDKANRIIPRPRGIWVPTILVGGSSVGITYGVTRAGIFLPQEDGSCEIEFDFIVAGLGGLTGPVTLDPACLPYAHASDADQVFALAMSGVTLTEGTPILRAEGSDWTFQRQTTTQPFTLNHDNIGAGARIWGSGSYRIAS
jgi:hypothetical protein